MSHVELEDDLDPETLAAFAASLRVPAPSNSIRARLLAAVEGKLTGPGGKYARFVDVFAEMFEITLDKARALLDGTADVNAYEHDPSGLRLIHFNAGPRLAAFDTGIVRFPAGMEWPLHRHIGAEHHLFFEGGIRVHQDGRTYGPGDTLVMPAGSEHSFTVLPGADCVTAVILEAGIEMPPGTPAAF